MSHRVAVMFGGKVLQCGTPEEVYHRPAARRVADYFGDCQYIAGAVMQNTFAAENLSCTAELPDGEYDLMLRSAAILTDRPGALELFVKEIQFRGADTLVTLESADGKCWKKSFRERPQWCVGERVFCAVDFDACVFFRRDC